MKNIIAALAALALTFVVLTAAISLPEQIARHSRTQEAEQTARRLSFKLAMLTHECSQVTLIMLQRVCKESAVGFYPALKLIRNAVTADHEMVWDLAVIQVKSVETSVDDLLKSIEQHKKSPASSGAKSVGKVSRF